MSSKASLTVLSLISCLTISQFALAQEPVKQPIAAKAQTKAVAPKTAKAATPAKKPVLVAKNSQTDELTLDTPDASAPATRTAPMTGETRTTYKPKIDTSFDGYAKSVVFATPGADEFMIGLDVTGGSATYSAESKNPLSTGLKATQKTSANSTAATIKPSFGISKNFYLGAKVGYQTGSNSVDSVDQNGYALSSNDKISGMAEPSLVAGAQAIFGNTHVIGELEGKVPMGNAQYTRNTNDITEDAKAGGGSFTPRIASITDVRKMKILGSLSYEVMSERKTDYSYTNYQAQPNLNPLNTRFTQTTTGGNIMTLSGGMEFPTILNTGFLLGYIKTEDSKQSYDTTMATQSQTTSTGYAQGGVALYAGIPIGQNTLIVPQATYLTMMDKSVGTTQYNQADVWVLNLGTKIKF